MAFLKLTLGDLMALEVDAVKAACRSCGHSWRAPYNFLPPSTSLARVASVMICPNCGGVYLEIAPAPTEGPVRMH